MERWHAKTMKMVPYFRCRQLLRWRWGGGGLGDGIFGIGVSVSSCKPKHKKETLMCE